MMSVRYGGGWLVSVVSDRIMMLGVSLATGMEMTAGVCLSLVTGVEDNDWCLSLATGVAKHWCLSVVASMEDDD